jgi:CRISPR-associated exonuclease Cas4
MLPSDIGGVHIKYLYHCPRQLWLYTHGVRPEHASDRVSLGEAVHETRYARYHEVDLGTDRIDHMDADGYVHEIKSSRQPSTADEAQAVHYCLRLTDAGIPSRGAVLHYPAVRRTISIPFDEEHRARAAADIDAALAVINQLDAPGRLERDACAGCSYTDYCWSQ